MTGLLYLLALIPLVLSQLPVEPTRGGPEPSPDDGPGGDCSNNWTDDYCETVAVNNWCGTKEYGENCCGSCKRYEDTKDPECHDVAQGCVYYKEDMCKPDYYPDECKKTCDKC